jgi:hypothetical protein
VKKKKFAVKNFKIVNILKPDTRVPVHPYDALRLFIVLYSTLEKMYEHIVNEIFVFENREKDPLALSYSYFSDFLSYFESKINCMYGVLIWSKVTALTIMRLSFIKKMTLNWSKVKLIFKQCL